MFTALPRFDGMITTVLLVTCIAPRAQIQVFGATSWMDSSLS